MDTVRLGDVLFENRKSTVKVETAKESYKGNYPFFTSGKRVLRYTDYLVDGQNIYLSTGGNAVVHFYDGKAAYSTDTFAIKSNDENVIETKFIFHYLESITNTINDFYFKGRWLKHLQKHDFRNIQIPLPSLAVQQKIISEIEMLEKEETDSKTEKENTEQKTEPFYPEAYNMANCTLHLSDSNIFDISIGKRVIKKDLNEKGTVPVYSANVFEPVGYIDRHLITDFSVPSILWGIDGAWLVNYMPAGKPFYPTDHCGVLRIKTDIILPEYLAWIFEKEGARQQFSRIPRASIDRIKRLSIKVPPLSEQKKIVTEIAKNRNAKPKTGIETKKIRTSKECIFRRLLDDADKEATKNLYFYIN
jgi:restriction endonuclease S subunit